LKGRVRHDRSPFSLQPAAPWQRMGSTESSSTKALFVDIFYPQTIL
jgi:hypothetical protein